MTEPAPSELPRPLGRHHLIAAITRFLANQHPLTLQAIRRSLEQAIDTAGPDAVACLGERLASAGNDWDFYPPDPLAKRIHHVLADCILEPGSSLVGTEHLSTLADRPVVLFANHLSYSDANVLDVLLHRAGATRLSDRLTVVAGPKVYSSLERRFSSLCFGTIKTPQSSALSTEDAVMNTRDVARAARRSIDIAHERLRIGDALLVFAEGTRSRTSGLQPMLAGVTRYLDGPDVLVVPVGIVGTEALYPIGEDGLHPVRAVASLGQPIESSALRERTAGDRRLLMDRVGLAISALLPLAYRGVYGDSVTGLDEARELQF
jgi:1-acyl-sn-glycerol-3-phosphate acyltransferase